MSRPWDFDEARAKCWEASQRQEAAEAALKQTYRDSAMAEEAYRVALADRILELRNISLLTTGPLEHAVTTGVQIRKHDRETESWMPGATWWNSWKNAGSSSSSTPAAPPPARKATAPVWR